MVEEPTRPRLLIRRTASGYTPTEGTRSEPSHYAAYTSLGEASARTQATDRQRRETPTVRTGSAGVRRSPKWLGSCERVIALLALYAAQCWSSTTGRDRWACSGEAHREADRRL